jgi:hypothetical protein
LQSHHHIFVNRLQFRHFVLLASWALKALRIVQDALDFVSQ